MASGGRPGTPLSATAGRAASALCAALAVLAVSAPGAQAGGDFLKSLWGPIKFTPGQAGCHGPKRCSAFGLYRQLGVEVFQFQLEWNEIAPTRPRTPQDPKDPAYRWSSELRYAVTQARKSGMKVMFMIKGSPPWANRGRGPQWAPRPAAYARFARAAARRFNRVNLWEVWGEPNRAASFMPQGRKGARRYARILDAAYGALKSIRRRNVVVGGMTLSGGLPGKVTAAPAWIKNLIGRGGRPPRMDWYGHNPYQRKFPRLASTPYRGFRGFSDIRTLWREVKRHYQRRINSGRRRGRRAWIRKRGVPRRLWLSEWSIQSDHGSYVFPTYVSRRQQARWLRAGFRLARKLPYVKGMGWYQLSDYPAASDNPTWGLIEYRGAKKPSFNAFRAVRR